jgi:hypothetical protein
MRHPVAQLTRCKRLLVRPVSRESYERCVSALAVLVGWHSRCDTVLGISLVKECSAGVV